MKIYYSIIAFIFAFSLNAQENKTSESTIESLAESEMKSAARLQSAAVNPNTLNYDITYHKLEFTVDPAVASIAGKVTTTYTATDSMSSLTFDLFDSITVSSVKMNGLNLVFTQPGSNELIITLPGIQPA